jgi:hypothetical protein
MTLTPGQRQIRALTLATLPRYQSCQSEEDYDDVYARLLDAFAADQAIITDPVTAQPLGYTVIAQSYLDWLREHSARTELLQDYPAVQLDQFVYQRPDLRKGMLLPRYTGGIKWESTMSCLFGLAEQRILWPWDCEARYFVRSGILTIAGGGNHRLLAHVLWGEPRIQPDSLELCEEHVDPGPSLNQALLLIESLIRTAWSSICVTAQRRKWRQSSSLLQRHPQRNGRSSGNIYSIWK